MVRLMGHAGSDVEAAYRSARVESRVAPAQLRWLLVLGGHLPKRPSGIAAHAINLPPRHHGAVLQDVWVA